MKLKNSIIILLCLFLFNSCDDLSPSINENNGANKEILTQLDELFTDGFTMELEQIYVMTGKNTIPIADIPVDSCFKGGNIIVNLPNYQTTEYLNDYILYGIVRYEKWNILPMEYETEKIYWEQGYGSNYQLVESIRKIPYNFILTTNQYTEKEFVTTVIVDNQYNYRGRDNHILYMNYQSMVNNKFNETNLKFEILTNNGNGLFDGKYIYLDTNAQVNMTQAITAPLTSNQVKIEINKGNYTIYMKNGLTYYQIGENLYLPRYGNSYVYAGSTNQAGMIERYSRCYYRFKFRIK